MRAGRAGRALPAFPALLRRDVDLDRARLGLFADREPDGQDAVLVLGRDLRVVDGLRQRERAAEGAIAPFDAMELFFLRLAGELLLAFDRERVVLHGDV